MTTRFADFDVAQVVRELGPVRVFLRRRDPVLRNVLASMLPEGGYTFVEIADAPLLLREASTKLLAWESGDAIEITMADRVTSEEGHRDILVGFRRSAWNPGVILVTALARTPDGNEEEYGSALVLGPGVSIALDGRGGFDEQGAGGTRQMKLAS